MINHLLHFLFVVLWYVQVCGEGLPSSAYTHHENTSMDGHTLFAMTNADKHLHETKAAGYVGAKAIFYGSDAFKDVHKEVAQVVVQSLCADLCKDIGAAYKSVDAAGKIIDGKLDYFSHKLLHAFTGAIGQAVKGPQAMLAGAAGGALGEILGEMFLNNKEMLQKITTLRNQGKSEAQILKEHVDVKAFLVKLSAGLAVGMFGLDMQAAHDAADCAIENNCGQVIMALLAAGYVYVTGEELVNAHKRGGFDEVLRVIKSEAEVVFITEATAAELGGMPGAALAAGGYMVYRIGGKLYPTAQKAWGALIKAQPALDNMNIQKGFADWCKGKGVKDVELSGLNIREQLFGKNPPKGFPNQRVRPINGRMPINHQYAGKTYTFDNLPAVLKEKYPNLQRDYQHGIPFTGTGHPDFSRYAKNKVEINFSGSRIRDELNANRLSGYDKTPSGFTWHHHHDGKMMQLVPTDLHDAIRHTGGFAKRIK